METLQDAFRSGRTLVFGHRGASAYAPMNTLSAYELAVKQGADGIELDVHLTKDRHIIIVHDSTVDETTDGRGDVHDMTLAQLKELDAGSWFGEEFHGTRLPTLDEVFEAVGNKLYINIELKSLSFRGDGLEEAVAQKIATFGLGKRVLISSFHPFALLRFRRVDQQVPMGFLHRPEYKPLLKYILFGLKHEARHPIEKLIDEHYMVWARQAGYYVNTWTVNDGLRAKELAELGVNMIMGDYPDVVKAAIAG